MCCMLVYMSADRFLSFVLQAIWRYISAASYTCRLHRAGLTGHPACTQLAGPGSSTFLQRGKLGKKSPELSLALFIGMCIRQVQLSVLPAPLRIPTKCRSSERLHALHPLKEDRHISGVWVLDNMGSVEGSFSKTIFLPGFYFLQYQTQPGIVCGGFGGGLYPVPLRLHCETIALCHRASMGSCSDQDQMFTFYLPAEPCLVTEKEEKRLGSGDMCGELALLAMNVKESGSDLSLTGNEGWPNRSWVLTAKAELLPRQQGPEASKRRKDPVPHG